jgi:hypothetical protein
MLRVGEYFELFLPALTETRVEVCFNRPVNPQSAGNPANYSLSDANLAVISAVIRAESEVTPFTTSITNPSILRSVSNSWLSLCFDRGFLTT